MHIDKILIGWFAIALIIVLIVLALISAGVISIHIEKIEGDEDDFTDEDDD